MKNWKLLCCGLLIIATGCASSSNSRYTSRWKQQKSTAHARLYNNGSHPSLGKLPQTDVPLVVNDAVMKWIGYFTGSPASRDRFARYLQRSGRYMDMMRETLRQHGMPQDLIYVALIESGFRNDAQSWASAVGTWQFIRGTARGYGLNIDSVVDERRDPEKAVDAAARYLKTLHAEFGDWYLAMAGYNAGEGRVRRAIARYGTNNFWQLAAMGNGAFRPETRDYVPKYIAATIIAKNPKRFGFGRVDYHEPLNYDTAQIKGQADLMAVADAVNVPVEVIKELNSELYAGVTPPGQYLVKLPVGTSQRFKREFPRVAKKYQIERRSMLAYRVRRGDSLGKIARRYGISARQLQAANRLRSGYLRAGQVLSIPAATRREASRAHVVAVAESVVSNEDTTTTSYTVRSGDRLSAISRHYGVTISDLRRWNKLRVGNLRVGQLLRIKAATDLVAGLSDRATGTMDVPETAKPVAMVATPVIARRPFAALRVNSAPKQSQTYRVRRGDVLSTIARRNGVTVRDLQAWNGLRGNRIMVGQQLRMTAPAQTTSARAVIARSEGQAPQSPPRTTHTYRVQRGDSLYVIAKRYGVTVNELQAWNRMGNNTLRAGQQLVVQQSSSPTTTVAKAEPRDVTAAAAAATAGSNGYRVRTGDTLGEIAERHNMTVADLRRLNRLSTRAVIRGGQTLKVRGTPVPSTETSAPPAATLAMATPQETAAKSLWTDRVSLAAATKPKARELIYQVKPGDTLWDISKAYEVSPEEIQSWNNLNHPNLKPGQKLTIRITS